jgi:hypothetical protein
VQHDPPRPAAYSDAEIAALLADLQATVTGPRTLRSWSEDTHVRVERVVAGADLMYVRLAGCDHEGSPIVLMLLDRVWERAI